MTQPSDIESLFKKFGGEAGKYQEIGREDDSSAARSRWPLLDTLDLSQAPIPPLVQAGMPATARPATTPPRLSRFAASPVVTPVTPVRANADSLRFAGVAATAPAVSEPPPAVSAHVATPAPAVAPVSPRAPASRFAMASPGGTMQHAAPPPAAPAPAASPAPQAAAVPARAQPGSILGKLFGGGTPAAPAAPLATAPDALPALFARLRDAPAAPEPRLAPANAPGTQWLTRGPRRP